MGSDLSCSNYVVEESESGTTVSVTGPWTDDIGEALIRQGANRLVLNYARGFSASSLDFIRDWPIRELAVLDRSQADASPVLRLGETLEVLSIQVAPKASALDVSALHVLRSLAGSWRVFAASIDKASALTNVVTWQYGEADLRAFGTNRQLQTITVKDAPRLLTLQGLAELQRLKELRIELARNLCDINEVADLPRSLSVLGFVKCPSLKSIDAVSGLRDLQHIEFGDCGSIDSLRPLAGLRCLESVYAWGNTRIADADLSPLLGLPKLTDLRIKPRREYCPPLRDVSRQIRGSS